ncbi:retrotransposon protein, putative, ty1-copia subclass [Tanacetum coccineum]
MRLHVCESLHEQTLSPKEVAPALHAIRAERIQKNQKKKSHKAAKGNQGKGKAKMGYTPVQAQPFALKPKNPPTPKKDNPAKDAICHQYGEVGIFTIELYSFPSTFWVNDTGCGTHICITTLGLKGSRKLKPGALSLYVGDGHHAAVEAVGDYHLCPPSGLVLILHNCHYAPTITRGIILVSRLYKDGFVNHFKNDNSIYVFKNNMIYFNVIPRDDIYEIVMSSSNTNESSMYAVSNKRAKLNLDSALLWHCHLGTHVQETIEQLQHCGLLIQTDIKSFEKCVACMSSKIARKPYSHQVEMAKDPLGLIYTDSFWDYALESTTRILNMVPTKNVDKTPYKVWHGQFPKLSYLKVWGCEALVKRDTLTKPDKLKPRAFKCIFVGYPKETTRYSFYYPPENKVFVARNAEFFENDVIEHEARGSLEDLEIIQEEDTHPSLDTSLNHEKDDQEIDEPQSDINPIHRSTRTRRAPDRMCLYIDVEEHELGDLGEPANYKAALLDPESDKKLNAMIFGKWMSKLPSLIDISIKRYTWSNVKVLSARDIQTEYASSNVPFMDLSKHLASGSYVAFLIFYVDDILIMGNNIPMLQDVKSYLGKCFAMKDLGEAAYILGIKIYQDRSKRLIGLCQSAYIEKILNRFYMENSKRGTITMQEKLKFSNLKTAVKNILKYLRNTKDMFLVYGGDTKQELRVSCYTDAGYLTDADDMKSQTGYVFVLNGGAIDWKNIKQSIFATSSTDAEYIAAFDASKEAVWIRKFISGLGVVPTIEEPINMYCDNTGAIAIAKYHGVTKGARHFHAKVHYLRETIEIGDVRIEKVDTDDNLAYPFTKALAFPKHSELTKKIGMIPASSLILEIQVISKSNGPLTPKATKVFEVIKKLAAQYTISWNGRNLYQAVRPKVGAIWNMAENDLEPGIPESWVHPSYWLATWEEMYRFKINPCNGPDLWPPSDSPITYTPPEYHKPAGRPSKKRKKSAAELFDGLVKNGKLSRFGQTITCCKCGQKGHNSRTCKGQRGVTSAPAVNQSQTTQTTVNPSAPAVNPSQTTQTTVNSPSQTSPTMRYTKQKASRYSPSKNTNASSSGKRKAGE